MSQEILDLTIKFVSENSEGDIINIAANTATNTWDFPFIIFCIIMFVGLSAGIALFVNRYFAVLANAKGKHVLKTNDKNMFKNVFVICLTLVSVLSLVCISKVASAQENQDKYFLNPEVKAYVNQDGQIRFDTATLEYFGDAKLHINNLNVKYCNNVNIEGANWFIFINGDEWFNGTVPGGEVIDDNFKNTNIVTFNVEGIDSKTALSLIDKNVLLLSFDVEEYVDPPAVVTTPPTAVSDLVYDEDHFGSHIKVRHNLITSGEAFGGTLEYYATEDADYTPTDSDYAPQLPQRADAGSYYIWYKAFGDADHKDSEAVRLADPVVISKATLNLIAYGHKGTFEYDGKEHNVSGYDVGRDGDTPFYLYKAECLSTKKPASVSATYVKTDGDGTYRMDLHVTDFVYADSNVDGHVRGWEVGWIQITPSKEERTITCPSSLDLVATPNGHIGIGEKTFNASITDAYEDEQDKITISTEDDELIDLDPAGEITDAPNINITATAKKGGTATIQIKMKNENYSNPATKTITVNIDMFTYIALSSDDNTNDNPKAVVDKYVGPVGAESASVPSTITDDDDEESPTTYDVVQIGDGTNPVTSTTLYAKTISLNDKVKTIAKNSFKGFKVNGVTLSITNTDKVEIIGESAFEAANSLTVFADVSSVTTIGTKAFAANAGLTQFGSTAGSIITPVKLTSMGEACFSECSNENLQYIDLSASTSLEKISNDAFNSCSNIKSAKIPAIKQNSTGSLTTIGRGAFANLSSYDFDEVDNITYDVDKTAVLWASNNMDPENEEVPEFIGERYEVPQTVKLIAEYAFSGSPNLKKFIIPRNSSPVPPFPVDKIWVNSGALFQCPVLETFVEKSASGVSHVIYGDDVLDEAGKSLENEKDLIVACDMYNVPTPVPEENESTRINLQFTAVSALSGVTLAEGNYYYMQSDITNITSPCTAGSGIVVVDINGKTVKCSGTQGQNNASRIFQAKGAERFYLLDTVTTSDIEGGYITGVSKDAAIGDPYNDEDAGGLYVSQGNVKIYDAHFKECQSHNDEISDACAGAIMLDILTGAPSLTIYNAKFSNCRTWDEGGAIWAGAGTNLNIYNAEFNSCISESEGGATYIAGKSNIQNASFINCKSDEANSTTSKAGAIFYSGNSELSHNNIENCKFTGNYSRSGAGAVGVDNNAGLTINKGCIFENNSCPDHGGAIWNLGKLSIIGNEENPVKFNNNKSLEGTAGINHDGAAIYTEHTISGISYCDFEYNISSGEGGAIYTKGYALGTIEKCTFTGNNCNGSNEKGGAAYLENISSGSAKFISCNFNGNYSSSGDAGALYISSSGSSVSITDCDFIENHAAQDGGAVYVNANGTSVNILSNNSNLFKGNYTEGDYEGGAVFVTNGKATISGYVFDGNHTSTNSGAHGGACCASGTIVIGTGVINISYCNLVNNYDGNKGANGALAYYGSGSSMNVSNCTGQNSKYSY